MRQLWGFILTICLIGLSGCTPPSDSNEVASTQPAESLSAKTDVIEWRLATSWPKNFPGLGMAPVRFANLVNQMSDGRLHISVYGAGELMPAFAVFDGVSQGKIQMAHSASYYWKGKAPAAQFFSSIPFGMTAQEMNGWLHHGGGMALWEEVYRPFGIIPLAGGNTGMQMGGWFNKPINSVTDFKGLKIRMPGLGGEVLKRLGAVPVNMAGREVYGALDTGSIDAAEWVGPVNDLALGLDKVAKYYYYPGWHEPGSNMEFLINKAAFENLPADLQAIVKTAARAISQDMLDDYTTYNVTALDTLVNSHGVVLKAFPNEVMDELARVSKLVLEEQASQDALMGKVYRAYQSYEAGVREYHRISEDAYSQQRQR
ncbi:TRAP transporter substrate-binding protein DctP [Shewanella sp. A25]|nr:TRAP transporter substrate-binding protein DctP [Shewanella shenzhenensis]